MYYVLFAEPCTKWVLSVEILELISFKSNPAGSFSVRLQNTRYEKNILDLV